MSENAKGGARQSALSRHMGTLMFLVGLIGVLVFGWIFFPPMMYSSTEQPLQFNHKIHKEEADMECADCHPFRDDGTFASLPTLEQCAECHEEPIGESEAEKAFVDEYVTPGKEVFWYVYSRQPMNAFFSHVAHVKTGGFTCEECHGDHGDSESIPPYVTKVPIKESLKSFHGIGEKIVPTAPPPRIFNMWRLDTSIVSPLCSLVTF